MFRTRIVACLIARIDMVKRWSCGTRRQRRPLIFNRIYIERREGVIPLLHKGKGIKDMDGIFDCITYENLLLMCMIKVLVGTLG